MEVADVRGDRVRRVRTESGRRKTCVRDRSWGAVEGSQGSSASGDWALEDEHMGACKGEIDGGGRRLSRRAAGAGSGRGVEMLANAV